MNQKKSFWETVPGILTAVGGTVAGIAALLTALYTTGLVGNKATPTPSPAITVQSPSPKPEMASPEKPLPVITVQSPSPERERTFESTPPNNFYIISVLSQRRNDWSRLNDQTWAEKYDDGHTNEFRVSGRPVINNCKGTLLYRLDLVDIEVFIPDKECPASRLLFRSKKGEWGSMGDMQGIQ